MLASTPAEMLSEANLLAKQENYSDAIKLYEQLVETEHSSADLHYNLGTAYIHQSNVADAILNLRRALKIDPQNKPVLQNLKIARSMVSTEIIAIPEFFLTRYWTTLSNQIGSTTWAWLGLLLLVGMVLGIYKWLIGTEVDKRRKAFYVAVICVVLFLITFLAGLTQYKYETNRSQAVIMNDIQLLSGADERSEELYPLSPGVEVRLMDKIGDFYKVKLVDQETGWINQSNLRII